MSRYKPKPLPARSHDQGLSDGRNDHDLGIPRIAGQAGASPYWTGWRDGWDLADAEKRGAGVLALRSATR
jgi:hypothetical protein